LWPSREIRKTILNLSWMRQFSMPFGAAVAVIRGAAGLDQPASKFPARYDAIAQCPCRT
jgi:hypothetical protein